MTDDDLDALSGAWAAHADAIAVVKEAGSGRALLGFPKLRWARPYPTLTLRRVRESASFEVVAAEERQPEPELADAVAAYLNEHPVASGNEVYRAVGGRKANVLTLVRSLKEASEGEPLAETFPNDTTRFPRPGNRQGTAIPEEAASPLDAERPRDGSAPLGQGFPSVVPDRFPFPYGEPDREPPREPALEPPREPVGEGS